MYVCLCNAVSDKVLAKEVKENNLTSIKSVRDHGIKVCDQCCKCNADIKSIIKQNTEVRCKNS